MITTCPVPDDVNPLMLTGFQFSVAKLPELTYWIQQTEIPSISLGSVETANPLVNIKHPGEKIEFAELQVQFLVDSQMKNWNSIFFWMRGLGFPESHEQYREFLNFDYNRSLRFEASKMVSDATLIVLDGTHRPMQSFTFIDMFPTNLSGIEFDATSATAQQATARATFAYSYFVMNDNV